ncbi:MAG: ParA family partition ATPase [Janthinobacterium lividum]
MKSIAFLSQKGGSGKTTLAVHTTVAAQEAQEKVFLIDTDPQKSATIWSEAREAATPVVVTIAAGELEKVLTAGSEDGMSLAIVDTAPHTAPDAARIAKLVDLVVIPCRPTAFDLAAVSNAVEIVRAAKKKAVLVLSACPFRSPEISETRAVLEEYGLPVCPFDITDRRAFARAVATGRAVTEFEAEGKAAQEIQTLWKWLKEQIQ